MFRLSEYLTPDGASPPFLSLSDTSSSPSPKEYLDSWRRRSLHESASFYSSELAPVGLTAYVSDDEVVFKVTDPAKCERIGGASQAEKKWSQFRNARAIGRSMVQEIALQMVGVLKDRFDRLTSVPCDTLATDYYNAGAGPVLGGEGDIVFVNEGLAFSTVWFLLKAQYDRHVDPATVRPRDILKSMANHAREDASQVRDLIGHQRGFADFLVNDARDFQIFSGVLDHLAESTAERDTAIAKWKTKQALRFIVLHEFGHIALGHTDQLRQWSLQPNPTDEQLRNRRSIMRQCEFEADSFATDYFIRQYTGEIAGIIDVEDLLPQEMAAGGIKATTALFCSYVLGEHARAQRAGESNKQWRSHPSAAERLEHIETTVNQRLGTCWRDVLPKI